MSQSLPPDVVMRLSQDFGGSADIVAALLLAARMAGVQGYVGDRLVRCIVQAADGDIGRARQLIEMGRNDFRDVIVAGEYDRAMRHIRDLRVTFLIDSAAKFWISETACMMASRGYRLTSLDTHSATAGSLVYSSDFGEGVAIFVGPKGEVKIEKRGRQWTIHGNRHDPEAHEMNRPFDGERVFRDAVWCYLLSDVMMTETEDQKEAGTARGRHRPWWKLWN